MIDAGDIHLADLNEESRRRVLVVSNARFNEMSGRVFVAPEVLGAATDVPFPWRISIGGAIFAVDHLRSLPVERLLRRTERAPHSTMIDVRRVVLHVM
jgi:mRNA-degrading endonuclease toxin of MazEF toxin-antitoxin module